MKGTIVPIKPEVVVKVIECGPLRIGGHVRIMFSDGSMVIHLYSIHFSCIFA